MILLANHRITALRTAHHTSPESPQRVTMRQSSAEMGSLKGFIVRGYGLASGPARAEGHV